MTWNLQNVSDEYLKARTGKNLHNEYGYDLTERKKQDGIQDLVSFLDYGYSNR